jgi:hypothetical protein
VTDLAPPPRPDQAAPVRHRRRRVWIVLGSIFAAIVMAVLIVALLPSNRWFWSKAVEKGPHSITYEVTGSMSSATVTYETTEGQEVQKEVPLPWDFSFSAAPGTDVKLSATSSEDGTIACRIKWEGHTFSFDEEIGSSRSCGTDGES